MRLHQYLSQVEGALYPRRDFTIEMLSIREVESTQTAILRARVRFLDGSLLEFAENLAARGTIVVKKRYAYHYQDDANQLIFRYDNAPHHPNINTYPHHKHVAVSTEGSERVVEADPPDLKIILEEIEAIICQKE